MINPYYLGILIWLLFVIVYFCWLFRIEDGAVNKKIHMKRISFSVELNRFYRCNTYCESFGFECMICKKRARYEKQMVTHLTHDHLDVDFAEIKKVV